MGGIIQVVSSVSWVLVSLGLQEAIETIHYRLPISNCHNHRNRHAYSLEPPKLRSEDPIFAREGRRARLLVSLSLLVDPPISDILIPLNPYCPARKLCRYGRMSLFRPPRLLLP